MNNFPVFNEELAYKVLSVTKELFMYYNIY